MWCEEMGITITVTESRGRAGEERELAQRQLGQQELYSFSRFQDTALCGHNLQLRDSSKLLTTGNSRPQPRAS